MINTAHAHQTENILVTPANVNYGASGGQFEAVQVTESIRIQTVDLIEVFKRKFYDDIQNNVYLNDKPENSETGTELGRALSLYNNDQKIQFIDTLIAEIDKLNLGLDAALKERDTGIRAVIAIFTMLAAVIIFVGPISEHPKLKKIAFPAVLTLAGIGLYWNYVYSKNQSSEIKIQVNTILHNLKLIKRKIELDKETDLLK